MKYAARNTLMAIFAGMLITAATAWVPMFFPSEVSAVPLCSRAWSVDSQRIGTVLERHFAWWLPVDLQEACVRQGRIALVAVDDLDPEHHAGPTVYFTGYDSWAVPIRPTAVCAAAPDWSHRFTQNIGSDNVQTVVRIAAGWPRRCVEGFETYSEPSDEKGALKRVEYGLIGRRGLGPLPYSPLLSGLIVDALAWSAVLACALAALRRGMHWLPAIRRGSRRLCVSCGYHLIGLAMDATCPECGRATERLVPPTHRD